MCHSPLLSPFCRFSYCEVLSSNISALEKNKKKRLCAIITSVVLIFTCCHVFQLSQWETAWLQQRVTVANTLLSVQSVSLCINYAFPKKISFCTSWMNVNGRPGPFVLSCFFFWTILVSVGGGHEVDCEGRLLCSPWHFVLMLVKNKHNGDTAGSYHITIVSFNKHFLKLYIFIMQGSSLVDIETHSVWVWRLSRHCMMWNEHF